MDIKEIQELAELMQRTGLTKLEYKTEEGQESLRMERGGSPAMAVPGFAPLSAAPAVPVAAPAAEAAAPQGMPTAKGKEVVSPTVGVFYASPSPESDPFVQVGDTVKKGDVLCIIEAMKLMNEITAETDGVVTEICAGNGQVVEYNQTLFRIL